MTGNILDVAAIGATAFPSIATSDFDFATNAIPVAPYPPIPQLLGETTDSTKPAATTASNAFPPCLRIAAPVSADSGLGATHRAWPRPTFARRGESCSIAAT